MLASVLLSLRTKATQKVLYQHELRNVHVSLFFFFRTCPHVKALDATDKVNMDLAKKLHKSVMTKNGTNVNAE